MKGKRVNTWKVFVFNIINPIKKILVWCFIAIYWFCILLFTVVVPITKQTQPISFVADPTVSLIMVLFSSILIGFITVEIFRTPIDNGSELILITKAISRANIVIAKFLISLLYILFISLVSSAAASIMFVNPNWDYEQSLRITLGMGIGTFFTGLIMTSIASLFSMFFSKIKSLVFTMSFAFSMMLASFLGTYSVQNEIKYLEERGVPVQPLEFLNIKDKKHSYITGFDESYVKLLDENESVENLFRKSKSVTNFTNFAKYDPGTNLTSLFTLNATSTNFIFQYRFQQIINNPYEITFENTNINDYTVTKLEYGLGNGKKGNVSLIPRVYFLVDVYREREGDNGLGHPDITKKLFDNFFTRYSEEYLIQYWNDYWFNYGENYQIGEKYDYTIISKKAHEIYSKFIVDKYKHFNNKTSEDILIETSILSLSAVMKAKNISGSVDNLSFEEIMILRTAGFPIQWYLRNNFTNINHDIFNDANNLYLLIDNNVYAIYTPSWLVDIERYNSYFVGAKMVRVNNLITNAVVWTILPLSLIITTGFLYTRRDFK